MGVDGQRHAPAALIPWIPRYPLYRRLGEPHGQTVRKILHPPPGFHPRTVQPVANRYTNWAIPVHNQFKDVYYFPNVCIPRVCTHTHTHNEWLLDFKSNQEILAYLEDVLWRHPRKPLKCFHVTNMRTGCYTQDEINYLFNDIQLGRLCSTNWSVALYTLNWKACGR